MAKVTESLSTDGEGDVGSWERLLPTAKKENTIRASFLKSFFLKLEKSHLHLLFSKFLHCLSKLDLVVWVKNNVGKRVDFQYFLFFSHFKSNMLKRHH